MSRAVHYPPADVETQWLPQFSGVTMQAITKVVLHTTESSGWPGYPSFAPQLTYHPFQRKWRQHMDLDRSASTLQDPESTAVRENRDNVVQVEIVATCDPRNDGMAHFIDKIPLLALGDLGKFLGWLHLEWGTPLTLTPRWLPYPQSYGRSEVRMTGPQFDAFQGVLGHQHVSGNQHGDPGDLDVLTIITAARHYVEEHTVPEKRPDYDPDRDPLDQDRVPTAPLSDEDWKAAGPYVTAGGHLRRIEAQNAEIIRLLKGK